MDTRLVGADDVVGCLLHSDRGSQCRARKAQRALSYHQMVGSMGRVGFAGDNAVMESFFALLQRNVLDRRRWDSRDELRIAIVIRIPRSATTSGESRRRVRWVSPTTSVSTESCLSKTPAQQAGGACQQRSRGSALR